MRGNVSRRGDKWLVTIHLGKNERGRYQRCCYTRDTKRDAEKLLVEKLRDLEAGQFAPPQKQTLAQYVATWLETTARLRVADRTLQSYRGACRSRIIPALGHHRLDRLTATHIQAAWSQMAFGSRKDGRGGTVSVERVRHCHSILSSALRAAVKQGLLGKNPCDGAELPPLRLKPMAVLNEGQMAELLAAARGRWVYMPVLLAVTTGMRRGEILGLRWQDVDLDGAVLLVCRSAQSITGQPITFKEPKGGRPRRITLPEMLIVELRRHRATQAEQRLRIGPIWQHHDLICCHEDGLPVYPDSLTRAFQALLAKTDLPKVKFHGIRHAHASFLLMDGQGVNLVQERLGHAHPSVTLGIYGHVLPQAERRAAEAIDRMLKGTGT